MSGRELQALMGGRTRAVVYLMLRERGCVTVNELVDMGLPRSTVSHAIEFFRDMQIIEESHRVRTSIRRGAYSKVWKLKTGSGLPDKGGESSPGHWSTRIRREVLETDA